MSKTLGKASSLFNVIKKLKHQDCANFLSYLDDRGVELLCRILHYILNGDFPMHGKVQTRLQKKKKIRAHLTEFRRLAAPPRRSSDISKKRKILQRGGILGVLSAIAGTVIPLLAQNIANKTSQHRR